MTLYLMKASRMAAMPPPRTGEMTQLAAIELTVSQLTTPSPAAAIPAPMTPPTTAWVVDTGALAQVATLTQRAAANSADIIVQMNISLSCTAAGSIIPFWIVLM